MTGLRMGRFGLAGVIVAGTAAASIHVTTPGTPRAVESRPECPITSDTLVIDSLSNHGVPVTVTEVPLAGPISHVPEFHDCQRFVLLNRNRAHAYDSLYAVFASYQLATLADTLAGAPSQSASIRSDSSKYRSTGLLSARTNMSGVVLQDSVTILQANVVPGERRTRSLSFVQIYSWGGRYLPLGILPGFNCLYMRKEAGAWRSMMVAVRHERNCLTPFHLLAAADVRGVKRLFTTAMPLNPGVGITLSAADVPPVARWDWDRRNNKQVVGVRCGDQWCVASEDASIAFYDTPDAMPTFETTSGGIFSITSGTLRARVLRVRGWFDFQELALPAPAGAVPQPSGTLGWVVPNPQLNAVPAVTDIPSEWFHAANQYVTRDYDNGMVLLKQGWNKVYVCKDTGAACGDVSSAPGFKATCPIPQATTLYTRVEYRDGSRSPVRRVCRRGHDSMTFQIPGTTRWRWMVGDETTWMRCALGCCELQ